MKLEFQNGRPYNIVWFNKGEGTVEQWWERNKHLETAHRTHPIFHIEAKSHYFTIDKKHFKKKTHKKHSDTEWTSWKNIDIVFPHDWSNRVTESHNWDTIMPFAHIKFWGDKAHGKS